MGGESNEARDESPLIPVPLWLQRSLVVSTVLGRGCAPPPPGSALSPEGRQKCLDQMHISLTVAVKNIVVSTLIENVQRFRLRGSSVEQFRVAYLDQLVVPRVQHQRAPLKTAQFRGIIKMALQLVDQGCFGHAEFFRLNTHEKPFDDIRNAAFENHTDDLWVSGYTMHGIQRPN